MRRDALVRKGLRRSTEWGKFRREITCFDYLSILFMDLVILLLTGQQASSSLPM